MAQQEEDERELDHEQRIQSLEEAVEDMEQRIREAVSEGVVSGFDKLFERSKQQAAERTGRWIWSFVKDTVIRWAMILAIVVSVGKAAGWQLAASVFDAIAGKK